MRIFYITGMQPGTVIALDDHALSDQMQEILKGVTSSFHRPFVYHTVSRERTGQICTIPERCVWWVAKVEGSGDDQVFNRMLTCWIDDSDELDLRVLERTLEKAAEMPSVGEDERDEILVCQELWQHIQPAFVIIPYASGIRFTSASNRRNPDMLLDLIRSHAILMQAQREERYMKGIRCIVATEDDFLEASRLYIALNNESGGQMTKLTRREAELVDQIHEYGRSELTVTEMQQLTGWTNSTINKLLNGYLSKGQAYSGLLEKCPAISFLDRTITTESGERRTTQRRVRVYTWDQILYSNWKAGGLVWLAPSSGDDFHHDDRSSGDGVEQGNNPSGDDLHQSPAGDDDRQSAQPGPGGRAVEDGIKRTGADCCRPKNPENTELINKINNNTSILIDRAATTGSMKHTLDTPDLSPGDNDSRSAAQVCDLTAHLCQNDKNGQICREEAPAQTPDLPSRSALSPIDPEEFIEVEGWPQKKPCIVCGRSYTQYQERMTPERIAGPPRPNRVLCRVCYESAWVRAGIDVRTIPGVPVTGTVEIPPGSGPDAGPAVQASGSPGDTWKGGIP